MPKLAKPAPSSGVSVLIGPDHLPITGQSDAFNTLKIGQQADEIFVHYPARPLSFRNLAVLLRLAAALCARGPKTVYLTISRTPRGFLRDALILSIARMGGARTVVHLHGADFARFLEQRGRALYWMIGFVYARVSAAIVLCPEMRKEFAAFPGLPVHVIANAASRDVAARARQARNVAAPAGLPLRLLFLSNLIPSKGLNELIGAITEIRGEGGDVELAICGRQGFSRDLDDLMTALPDGINYLGPVIGEEKLMQLEQADVVVLPSYYSSEAQPICLIEAMHFGKAVIYTDHNYLPDCIPEAAGICIQTRSVTALSTAIRTYAGDRALLARHGKEGQHFARQHHTEEVYGTRVRELLLRVRRQQHVQTVGASDVARRMKGRPRND